MNNKKIRSPWSWIPSLYFAEGIPYIIVQFVASDMFKTMGVSNAKLAFWTSLLYLPWMIKPLWSPLVDIHSTKRKWIFVMQLILGFAFIGVATSLQLPFWFAGSLIFLWMMAFTSATHDIAADGFYMLALDEHKQAFFTGIRSTFYRLAMITGLGFLVMLTGLIMDHTGLDTVSLDVKAVPVEQIVETINPSDIIIEQQENVEILVFPKEIKIPLVTKTNTLDSTNIYFVLSAPPENNKDVTVKFGHKKGSKDISLVRGDVFKFDSKNWNVPQLATIKVAKNLVNPTNARFDAKSGNIPFSWGVSMLFLGGLFLFFSILHRFILPYPDSDKPLDKDSDQPSFVEVFTSFFKKKGIVVSVLFLILYRFSESQLTKMASPFLLDARENGGLALSLTEKGFAYGTVGLLALTLGGISGGLIAAKDGLKKWIWPMALSINLPNLVYVYMSYAQPDSRIVINVCIAIEQFGYGFGFTGYMLYMLYIAGQGKYKTAHFAICTAFMAMGMMFPGMLSGWVQELLGYQKFFIYVIICTIPSFAVLSLVKIDPKFGLKKK